LKKKITSKRFIPNWTSNKMGKAKKSHNKMGRAMKVMGNSLYENI